MSTIELHEPQEDILGIQEANILNILGIQEACVACEETFTTSSSVLVPGEANTFHMSKSTNFMRELNSLRKPQCVQARFITLSPGIC